MVWILLRSLLLRLDRLDMLVSGAGLVMGKAVSGFLCWLLAASICASDSLIKVGAVSGV